MLEIIPSYNVHIKHLNAETSDLTGSDQGMVVDAKWDRLNISESPDNDQTSSSWQEHNSTSNNYSLHLWWAEKRLRIHNMSIIKPDVFINRR